MSLRTDQEKEIYKLMDIMDPSGRNTARMKSFFSGMSDKEFYQHMVKFYENDDMNFPVGYIPYDNPVTLDFAHKVARETDTPIYELVWKPYVNGDVDDPPGTVHPLMVLEAPVKRLKQTSSLKNHASTSGSKRDPRTGQVTGEDRTARVTDVEAFSLLTMGQYHTAQEQYGPMADDTEAHYEMLREIQRNGEVSLSDLSNDSYNKVTLNTINAYMLGAGLMSNLVDESGYILPITMQAREDRETTIKR